VHDDDDGCVIFELLVMWRIGWRQGPVERDASAVVKREEFSAILDVRLGDEEGERDLYVGVGPPCGRVLVERRTEALRMSGQR
jgi:hypothetical protein